MRFIPKKTNVKNAVWRCWGVRDICVAAVLLVLALVFLTTGRYAWMAVFLVLTVALMMPTQDGIVYTILWGYLKYFVSVREFTKGAGGRKDMGEIYPVKAIRTSGVIEYRDGRRARVIRIGQTNFAIKSEEDQNLSIERFAAALKLLDLGSSADLVKVERAVDLCAFSAALEEKLKASEESSSPKDMVKREILEERLRGIEAVSGKRRRYLPEFFLVIYGRDAVSLETTAAGAALEIEGCGLKAEILDGKDAAIFLKLCRGREFDEKEADGKSMKELLSWVTPKKVSVTARGVVSDGLGETSFAVSDYPSRVRNAWAAGICGLEGTKTVFHIKPVEQGKAIKRIDRCVSESETKSLTSYRASEAAGAETHRESMLELLDSLQREGETLFDVSVTVTAYDYEKTGERRQAARRALQRESFRVSNLYAQQASAFSSAQGAPGKKGLTQYERGINSSSLAAAFPFVRTYVADEDGLLLGSARGCPFILNIWKRGENFQNSNAMVIGKSGSGKSFFMKSLIAGEWSEGTRVMILDPESEYGTLTKNLRGDVVDVGNAREGRINPFHVYQVLTDDGRPAEPDVTFGAHLKTLESFFRIVLEGASEDVRELINTLTVEAYARRGITDCTDCSAYPPEAFPTFSDLTAALSARAEKERDPAALRDLRTAGLYLEKFVTGRYSDIWNGPSTMDAGTGIADFDFQSLFAAKNGTVANAQMLLVFRYIEQEVINSRKAGGGERILIVVDEAHLFVDAKYPEAVDFFSTMCKRIRKYGGAFLPATQNVADWNASEYLKSKTTAILKNSQYLFVFKLSSPDMKDLLELYRGSDGFNEEEQRRILSFPTGEALFVGGTELRTCVKVKTPDGMKKLFGE